jgi:hypothetical protein
MATYIHRERGKLATIHTPDPDKPGTITYSLGGGPAETVSEAEFHATFRETSNEEWPTGDNPDQNQGAAEISAHSAASLHRAGYDGGHVMWVRRSDGRPAQLLSMGTEATYVFYDERDDDNSKAVTVPTYEFNSTFREPTADELEDFAEVYPELKPADQRGTDDGEKTKMANETVSATVDGDNIQGGSAADNVIHNGAETTSGTASDGQDPNRLG